MLGLLEKDFRLTFIRKQTIGIFLFMALVMGISMNGSFLIAYLTMLAMVLGTGSITYDEFDNCFPFLMTLPFDRKTYVREKYLFCLIAAVLAWSFGAVIVAVIDIARNGGAGLSEIPMMTAVIPSMYFATVIIVPLQLKYGAEKSRLALFIIFGLIAVCAILTSKVVQDATNPITNIINTLRDLPGAVTLLALFAVCAVATLISYLFSVRIMENKEF